LTVEEKIKSPFFHIGVLKMKADALLRLTGQRQFGFNQSLSPEDKWFTRVLRKIDPFNILKAFKIRVHNLAPPNILPAR